MQKNKEHQVISSQSDIQIDFIKNHPLVKDFKRKAKKLKKESIHKNLTLNQCQEIIVKENGYKNWHEFNENIKNIYKDKKSLITYWIPSNVPKLSKKIIKIGYDNKLGLSAVMNQNDFLKNTFIAGENNFRNNIEINIIKQLINNNQHILYMDGQNNIEHTNNIIKEAKSAGREKDIRILSFIPNEVESQNSNYNWYLPKNLPFNSTNLTNFLYSLCTFSEEQPLWGKRAFFLLSSISPALIYMRDNNEIILDFDSIKKYLIFDNIINLLNRKDFSRHIKEGLMSYLSSVPEFKEKEKSINQPNETRDYHGYLQMLLYLCFSQYSDTYAHLFKNGENVNDSKKILNEFYGAEKKLIFIVKFPKSHFIDHLAYFMIGLLKCNINNQILNTRNSNDFKRSCLIINSCPILNNLSELSDKLRMLQINLLLSYDINNTDLITSVFKNTYIKINSTGNTTNNFKLTLNNIEHDLTL